MSHRFAETPPRRRHEHWANGFSGIGGDSTSSANTILSNVASANEVDGILLDPAADNNKIRSNQANNNFGNGIRVESGATGNTITGNTALNNDAGINVYDNNPAPPPCDLLVRQHLRRCRQPWRHLGDLYRVGDR
jgi:parallel beta-helix repeat protein